MRSVVLNGFGKPAVLSLARDTPIPKITDSQVLLRVHAAGVNRGDTMQRKGFYPAPPGASTILGLEASGEIVEVGAQVAGRWKSGDRVMCLLSGGGYAEYVAADAVCCMPIPPEMPFTEAAAIPEVFLTAFQALRLNAGVKAGDNVLIHAGASGVGIAACQLCKVFGARALTTSSAAKVADCAKYADFAVSRDVDQATGKIFSPKVIGALGPDAHVDLVIDPVFGGGYLEEDVEVLGIDGKIVVLAFMGGATIEKFNAAPLFKKRVEIKFSTLRSQSASYKERLVAEFTSACWDSLIEKKLRPVIHKVFSLDDVVAAHEEMERNANIGKIVLAVQHP